MPLLRTITTEGAARGIVTVRAPHELQDQEVVWLQDALVNQAGLVVRRNGIPAVGTFVKNITLGGSALDRPSIIVACSDPAGTLRYGIAYQDNTTGTWTLATYDTAFTFRGRQRIGFSSTPGVGQVMAHPTKDGGVAIACASIGYGAVGFNNITVVWYGCAPTINYGDPYTAPTTVSVTINRGSTVVTMSVADTAKCFPGTIIQHVGVVRSIISTTTVQLMDPYFDPNLAGVTKSLALYRNPYPIRTAGLVNAATSGNSLAGFGTKFDTSLDGVGTNPPITAVATLLDTTSGQVIATSAITATPATKSTLPGVTVLQNASMAPYKAWVCPQAVGTPDLQYHPFALQRQEIPSSYALADFGKLVTSYKDYQFWANCPSFYGTTVGKKPQTETSRVWIAGPSSPFEIDHADDGTWFDVPTVDQGDTNIVAVGTTVGGAVFGKRQSVWRLSGDDPDNFQLDKVHGDGILGCAAITPYASGVIWANKSGIWYFDGTNPPENLVKDTIQNLWIRLAAQSNPEDTSISGVDTNQSLNYIRMFVYREHLFITMGNTPSGVGGIYSGNTLLNQTSQTLVMYLPTRAVNFWTNFHIQTFLPPNSASASGWVLVTTQAGGTLAVNLDAIMDADGAGAPVGKDNFVLTRGAIASTLVTPMFYMETKRYDLGDALNRKVWKGLAWEALFTNAATTAQMKVDYVLGLNAAGTTITTAFPDTLGLYKAQRIKFRARDQFLGFRIYEDNTSILTRSLKVVLAAWQLMYKPGRPGAI